jgi:hypothetical protein
MVIKWFIRGCTLVALILCASFPFVRFLQPERGPWHPGIVPLGTEVLLVGVLATLVAIVCLNVPQSDRAGARDKVLIASSLCFVGIALLLAGLVSLSEPNSYFSMADAPWYFRFDLFPLAGGVLLASAGMSFLGGVLLASGVGPPRWCGALIIASLLVFFLSETFLSGGNPVLQRRQEVSVGTLVGEMLVGVAWALVAYATWRQAEAHRPTPVR